MKAVVKTSKENIDFRELQHKDVKFGDADSGLYVLLTHLKVKVPIVGFTKDNFNEAKQCIFIKNESKECVIVDKIELTLA